MTEPSDRDLHEERAQFFALSLELLCIAGTDGYFKQLNPQWERTLGYRKDELFARPFIDFVHPDDRAATLAESAKLGEGGHETVSFENRYRCRDGSYRWLLWNASASPARGLLYAVARDITERREAENELRESERRYRDLFENATDLIQSVAPDGRVLYANESWKRVLGYDDDDLAAGVSMMDFVHPDSREHCMAVFGRLMAGEDVGKVEADFLSKDGCRVAVEGSVSTRFSDGAPVSTRGIFHDVTERRRLDRLKNDFISTVSHELRTPLTSIRGALGLLSGVGAEDLPEQTTRLIGIATSNCDRLVRLINDILDVQKIESGKLEVRSRPVEIGPLVRATLEMNEALASSRGVRLAVREPMPAVRVEADPDRLTQVLTNLVSNAVKFTRPDTTVELEASVAGGRVRVSVRDHGEGISQEFAPRVFERFSQADASTTRRLGGTGLGLSICRAIVQRLGGRIDFDTTIGEGTTFWFELPIWAASVEANPEEASAATAGRGVEGRVLICEGDGDVARLIRLLLEQAGFECELAPDADAARRLLAAGEFAAMTLDINLPGTNGLSLMRELRREPATRELPIVVVSLSAIEARDEMNGDAIGVIDWLAKPIDPERLERTVREAVWRSNGHRPRVLHVEDDADLVEVLRGLVAAEAEVVGAGSLAEARERLAAERFDLVVLDVGLPDGSGVSLIPELVREDGTRIPVVLFSGDDVSDEVAGAVAEAFVKSRTPTDALLEAVLAQIRRPVEVEEDRR